MIIEEVTKEIYMEIVTPNYIFDTVLFNELNKYKVDNIKYLLFKENRYRFGLCLGVKDYSLLCPFSAPFGFMTVLRKPISIDYTDQALKAIDLFIANHGYKGIRFILPPMFYDETGISILINALYRNSYSVSYFDLNFQFDLKKVCSENYSEILPHNGRKNLRIALDSNLILMHCDTDNDIKLAYEVISENRAAKGYPLRMTFHQVFETINIVKHDVFLVMKEQIAVAASLVYQVNNLVAQVIYWGDRPGYGELKPINFLSYQLIQYYGAKGYNYLDIGPSTESGIPNYGLCDFKQSIGCDISTKVTMLKQF